MKKFPDKVVTRWCSVWTLLVFVCVSQPSDAAIIFSALQEGAWSLFYQTEQESPPKRLNASVPVGDQSAPRLSPDGQQVAFEVTGVGGYVCPMINASECRKIKTKGQPAARPVWHPTTGQLIFVAFDISQAQEDSTLFITESPYETITPLLHHTGIQDHPDIAPDGRTLLYTSWQSILPHRGSTQVVQQLWMLSLESGHALQLLQGSVNDIHPRWSPDGKMIAFASNRDGNYQIWLARADGSNIHQLTPTPGAKSWPVWSPDGQRILFTQIEQGLHRLWLINVDGSGLRRFEPFGKDNDTQIRDADWQ